MTHGVGAWLLLLLCPRSSSWLHHNLWSQHCPNPTVSMPLPPRRHPHDMQTAPSLTDQYEYAQSRGIPWLVIIQASTFDGGWGRAGGGARR